MVDTCNPNEAQHFHGSPISPLTLNIKAVHYSFIQGTARVYVQLPDGRIFLAIQDGHTLASHTVFVNGFDAWPEVDPTTLDFKP